MTYNELVKKYNLSLKLYNIPFRTDTEPGEWDNEAHHYSFVIFPTMGDNYGKKIRGNYSCGSGIKNKPSIEDILNSLSIDTMSIESESFEQWCDEFGYDSDSRKAYKIYQSCLAESKQLKDCLGSKGLEELHQCEQL